MKKYYIGAQDGQPLEGSWKWFTDSALMSLWSTLYQCPISGRPYNNIYKQALLWQARNNSLLDEDASYYNYYICEHYGMIKKMANILKRKIARNIYIRKFCDDCAFA